MALKPTPPVEPTEPEAPAVEVVETREPGFHVMHGGLSLGCYPTAEVAELYADGHPSANGLEVTIETVTA